MQGGKPKPSKPKVEPSVVKSAPIPQETVSEKKEVPEPPPVPETPAVLPKAELVEAVEPSPQEASRLRDLGRGGELHLSIQKRLQAEAHTLGFFAERERQLAPNSNEAADLVVQKDGLSIAVEIAITTSISHEFGNVKKCLAAGFAHVAMISPSSSPERLQEIAAAVKAGLGPEAAAKVKYYTPDEFIAELRRLAQSLPKSPPPPPGEKIIKGYKVKRYGPKLSPEERKAKEDAANQILNDALKPKPKE